MPCRACRHAILGDEVVAHIRKLVDAAPPPDQELIAALRPILTNPAQRGKGATCTGPNGRGCLNPPSTDAP
ncbi:hypothetical protein ACFQ7Z_21985 [Streptomyces virginiae]|uniref:hypothetical protein n=1 Tax=Streptomyces virginiae TaxID=1961 RepID=UPI0036750827